MSITAGSEEQAEPPETVAKLEEDLTNTQKSAYTPGTLKNLLTHWRTFYRFAVKYKLQQWPVPVHTLCLFAQYLAYTFHSAKYCQELRIRDNNFTFFNQSHPPPPDLNDAELKLTFRGLNKVLAR